MGESMEKRLGFLGKVKLLQLHGLNELKSLMMPNKNLLSYLRVQTSI
jgi:hypothetical protein